MPNTFVAACTETFEYSPSEGSNAKMMQRLWDECMDHLPFEEQQLLLRHLGNKKRSGGVCGTHLVEAI